jgi:biopolymer transport protein ExbB
VTLERLLFFALLRSGAPHPRDLPKLGGTYPQPVATQSTPFAAGVRSLYTHIALPTPHQEKALILWLRQYRKGIGAYLRILLLIAVVSPLLGLLGTVLGMITAFQDIAAQAGPIGPALLAEGVWQAMLTTAVGLCIAIPAFVLSHGLRMYADNHVEKLAIALGHVLLVLNSQVVPPEKAHITPPAKNRRAANG